VGKEESNRRGIKSAEKVEGGEIGALSERSRERYDSGKEPVAKEDG